MDANSIRQEVNQAVTSLLKVAGLKSGQILVVGCSTSEIVGAIIGSASNPEVAKAVVEEILGICQPNGLEVAFQCCEHLNRALVVSAKAADKYGLEEVTVLPVPGAGGALAAAAMELLPGPVVVEHISGHAGIDIGNTMIGMHLRPVVIPVRLPVARIGHAHLVAARTRPKLIGGQRAAYRK
ncbi:MAG: TIGR01440 family protein [Bacillota bacterium]